MSNLKMKVYTWIVVKYYNWKYRKELRKVEAELEKQTGIKCKMNFSSRTTPKSPSEIMSITREDVEKWNQSIKKDTLH